MKKTLNWKEAGQFFAVLVNLFTVIRDTLKPMAIGIEIIPWLIDEGKEFFIETLKHLGENFQRFRALNDLAVNVNLDVPPKLPFDDAIVEKNEGGGWVLVEKLKDGLYIDGHKVILYLYERQKNGKTIKGYELREELTGKLVLHPNILDALIKNPHLIPEDWKWDENKNDPSIFFWAVIFCEPSRDASCVRFLSFSFDRWGSRYRWLGGDWDDDNPAALRAS